VLRVLEDLGGGAEEAAPAERQGPMRQCSTHWMACDCREARAARMEAALREILAIQGQIMPGWNDEFIRASWIRKIAEKALRAGHEPV
jgi:hypothetical protein